MDTARKIRFNSAYLLLLTPLFLVACGSNDKSASSAQDELIPASLTTTEKEPQPVYKSDDVNDDSSSPPSSLTKVEKFVPPTKPPETITITVPTSRINNPSAGKDNPGVPSNQPGSTESPAQELLRLTNQHRAKVGCPSVTLNAQLSAAATGHAKDMAVNKYFDHNSPSGEDPTKRAIRAGYGTTPVVGENIAAGQPNANEAFQAWLKSKDGHRENIEWCVHEELGVGAAQAPVTGVWYWVYVLGRKS